ncbi:MAG: hypothetical protein M0R77_14965 [Gammaproteobacteria bacterium]|nr:hypothetical protein [Gammaproteobacteria bacterium]
MKIDAVDDESGQVGFYIKQLSDLYEKMDTEISKSISEIEKKYSDEINNLKQIIESTKSLLL